MPYDSRPRSEGGNRGIDDDFDRCCLGKYRVVGVDTFDGTDWVQGDFPTLEEAKECANKHGGVMCKMHVYDPEGRHVHEAGSY